MSRYLGSSTAHLARALIALACWALPAAAIPNRNVALLAHFNDYPPAPGAYGYSSCWSYIHSDGREYAAIGTNGGTAIYNVTIPEASYSVGFIPGPTSIWRELKSYRDWIYVVTEGTGGGVQPAPGVQIIRMTDPEHPVLAATYAVNFHTSHTVSVDSARALLICNGTRFWSGPSGLARGMRVLSLANPEAPVEIGWWPGGALPVASAQYVHDSVPVGNRLYASSVYVGIQRVLDFTNPAAPVEVAAWTYSSAHFTHNAWPDASGNYVYVTDEQNGQTLRAFDISNLAAPTLVSEYTPNLQSIIHNAHVQGDELFLANYTEGIRVLDVSDPAHPAEYGWADTYPGASGGYNGVWGVAPFFPSGIVVASDITTGLYVFRPSRDYGLLRVEMGAPAMLGACGSEAACCCAPGPCSCPHTHAADLEGARVHVAPGGDSATVGADGVAQLALDPGAHTISVRKFGYEEATVLLTTTAGGRDTLRLDLVPRAVAPYAGTVRRSVLGDPLEGAEVILAYTPLHDHTGADGTFSFDSVPEDEYRVEVRRPGYVPLVTVRALGPGHEAGAFSIAPAPLWDAMESSVGWTIGVPGENVSGPGRWTWGDPVGTGVSAAAAAQARDPSRSPAAGRVSLESAPAGFEPLHEGHTDAGATPAGPVQPEDDRTPGAGVNCFFTGQALNSTDIYASDVDLGKTSLTSPILDAGGLADPVIGFWQWFYSEFGAPEDWFAVLLSNDGGTSWVPVDTTRGTRGHWVERAVRVSDYLTPTATMSVRFVAADFGVESAVEAGIDDLTLYDAATALTSVAAAPSRARLAFRPSSPNPSNGLFRLALEIPSRSDLRVEILDVGGRRVRVLHRGTAEAGVLDLAWDGADDHGTPLPAGRYFARARSGAERTETTLVRVR